jgi:L,D-peptidoglycan transpeptidase YkuD (ErfK/YbiS/YcfS/YnhG family)
MGFDDAEAANLTALTNGFAIGSQPWRVRELTRLLFLRALARTRGEWSGAEDHASSHVGGGGRVPGRTPRDLDQSDGRITLLTLFHAAAGPAATLDRLAPRALHPPSAWREAPREGG